MMNLHTPDQFKSRPARIAMGVLGMIFTYLMATRAFDTGSIWQYFVTIVLFVISVRLLILKSK